MFHTLHPLVLLGIKWTEWPTAQPNGYCFHITPSRDFIFVKNDFKQLLSFPSLSPNGNRTHMKQTDTIEIYRICLKAEIAAVDSTQNNGMHKVFLVLVIIFRHRPPIIYFTTLWN